MSASPRYLVTGATGFLGRHLLQQLLKQRPEAQALALVRQRQGWEAMDWTSELSQVQVLEGSLDPHDSWAQVSELEHLDGIFHLAALVRHSRQQSEEVYETNLKGTLNMVRLAAAKRCRLVYVSTSGTVGVFRSRHEWADEHAPYLERAVARWPYYHSKVKAEQAARALAQKLGVELVIIRPPVLLGPGDHRFRSTSHIIRYLRGRLPFLIRGGMHFIDIRDAAEALLRAMEHSQPQPIYHLSGVACSIEAFFAMVQKASGVAPPKYFLPHGLALSLAKASAGLARVLPGEGHSPLPDPVVVEMASCYWDVRSRYATQDLGFVNRYGQETIDDTVDWLYRHHPQLQSMASAHS